MSFAAAKTFDERKRHETKKNSAKSLDRLGFPVRRIFQIGTVFMNSAICVTVVKFVEKNLEKTSYIKLFNHYEVVNCK